MKGNHGTSWPARPYESPIETREFLPFWVRLAGTEKDLLDAVQMRVAAFERHAPEIAAALGKVEDEDRRSDVLVLIAERKLDGVVVGTIRLQPNTFRPLRVEGEVELPATHAGSRLLETTRLGVETGRAGQLVTFSLIKAAFEICHAGRVDFGIALGRAAMTPLFRGMQYDDLLGGPIPVSYAANVPHWVYSIPIVEVEARLRRVRHPMYRFLAQIEHPDISIDFSKVASAFGA